MVGTGKDQLVPNSAKPAIKNRFAVLQIRDVYPGSECPSRIHIKEFKYFSTKNGFLALGNMIRIVHPGSG
jgi:hypothetical protein